MKNNQKNNQNAFTLIELLVGLLLSMGALLLIANVMMGFEGQKRTTTQMSSAVQNGTLGLFAIEREIKMAGYGINNPAFMGCNVLAHDSLLGRDFTFTFTPVKITFGANDATPDEITVSYSSADLISIPAQFTENMPNSSADYKVSNRFGFSEGDLMIAVEDGKPCILAQVMNLPTSAGKKENIIHGPGNYTDPGGGGQQPTRYNKAGGLGVGFTTAGVLFNIGPMPEVIIFSVLNNNLAIQRILTMVAPQVFMDNIVNLKAAYGKDTNADGAIDTWDRTVPANGAEWAQVIAIRTAVLARSHQPEKPDQTTGECFITTNSVIPWNGGNFDVSGLTDWKCYRYRVFETTTPIRNMIWTPPT